MKSLSCRDAGFDCDHVVQAESDYEIFAGSENHLFNAHGMKKQDVIPAFNEKLKSFIKDTPVNIPEGSNH
jgi:predicted small metal-binding protein